ncbi:MAG: hypothetical protein ACFB0C_09265 [Leptolyngbyaceae cyanobacterium]
MLLSPGTTLHHNSYVIDALLESAEDGELYWGTCGDRPVYIQARSLKSGPLAVTAINLTEDLQAPDAPPPCLTGVLDTFIEDQSQYWVMVPEVGQPWSHRARYSGPLTVKQALTKLRQASEGLIWLMAQGINQIPLSPNHIWWCDLDSPLVLTGWLGNRTLESAAKLDEDFNPQKDLATLLWQFLSGQISPAPAGPELRQQLPHVSPQLLEGIQLGLNASPTPRVELPATLTTWLQSLPLPAKNDCLMHSQPERFNSEWASNRKGSLLSSPGWALTLTALIAALAGSGAGMAWRFAPSSTTSETARFSPDQGFPALSNWSGDSPEQRRERTEPRSGERWQPQELPQDSGLVPLPQERVLIQSDYLDGIPDRWAAPFDDWETPSAPVRPWRESVPGTNPALTPRPLERPQDGVPSSSPPVSPLPEAIAPEEIPETEPSMAEPAPAIISPEPAPPEAAPAPTSSDLSTAES